jgi:hypothetical protein
MLYHSKTGKNINAKEYCLGNIKENEDNGFYNDLSSFNKPKLINNEITYSD